MHDFILILFTGIAIIRWSVYYLLSSQIHTKANNNYADLPPTGVSVIIAAKNEEQNLSRLIPLLLEQDYPDFEIIVINDYSTDRTNEVIMSFKNHRLRLIQADQNKPGKKHALDQAIKLSNYQYLLFTDADCVPSSRHWIKSMVSQALQSDKKIVLGFSPVVKTNTLTGWISRYETLHTGLLYLGASSLGNPYMGVGRNLLYTKLLYIQNEGFSSHANISSGDDDLQIQKMADKANTAECIHTDAWMYTFPPQNLKQYARQKLRHVSVSGSYLPIYQYSLMLLALLHFLFYGLLLLGLYSGSIYMSISYLIWLLAMVIVLYKLGKKFKDQIIALGFPVFDFVLLVVNLITGLVLLVQKKQNQTIKSKDRPDSNQRGFNN